jgi:hypothetical protein
MKTKKGRKRRSRTRRIKGGWFKWDNPKKKDAANLKDCYRWNSETPEVCTQPEKGEPLDKSEPELLYRKYNYPGRTNIGRIPTRKKPSKKPMNWCNVVPGIGQSKLNYLNERIDPDFNPKHCSEPPRSPHETYLTDKEAEDFDKIMKLLK